MNDLDMNQSAPQFESISDMAESLPDRKRDLLQKAAATIIDLSKATDDRH